MAPFWRPKWHQNGARRLKSDLQKLIEFLLAFWKPLLPRFRHQNEAKRDLNIFHVCSQRSFLERPSERFSFGLGFTSFFSALGSNFGRIFVTFGPSASPSQKCRELAQNLPRTCQEPLPKTSAGERRPVNFHLPSSLHGATATVARRPDPNLPNIKMKGRRCPPLGASD